jgi:hypothetical protein
MRFGIKPGGAGSDGFWGGFLRIAQVSTSYNPRMAGAPSTERPVVLRRLGIMKDSGDPIVQESRAQRETSRDALELFATEAESAPRLERRTNAIRSFAASSIGFVKRNPIIGVIVVSAVCVVAALWAINRFVGLDLTSLQSLATVLSPADTSAATADDTSLATAGNTSTARSDGVSARATTNPSKRPTVVNAVRTGTGTVARAQTVTQNRAESAPVGIARPVGTTQPDRLGAVASVATPDAPAAVSASSVATAAVVDDRIYTAQDRDVVPPHTSETLPGPTISSWTTRINAMEVIVSQTGDVERARLVTPPQRMPDMFALSRAKVWKFTPAMKDGKPVRYRLLLTWEVNP